MDCFGFTPSQRRQHVIGSRRRGNPFSGLHLLQWRQHVFASHRRSNPESATLHYCVREVNKWIASGLRLSQRRIGWLVSCKDGKYVFARHRRSNPRQARLCKARVALCFVDAVDICFYDIYYTLNVVFPWNFHLSRVIRM